jgi:hypothetical protein
MELQKEAAKLFDELFLVTFKRLGLMGIRAEPSDVVKKVISPVKDAYVRGLLDLLTLMAQEEDEGKSAAGASPSPLKRE